MLKVHLHKFIVLIKINKIWSVHLFIAVTFSCFHAPWQKTRSFTSDLLLDFHVAVAFEATEVGHLGLRSSLSWQNFKPHSYWFHFSGTVDEIVTTEQWFPPFLGRNLLKPMIIFCSLLTLSCHLGLNQKLSNICKHCHIVFNILHKIIYK